MTTGANLRRLDRTRLHDGPMTVRWDGDVFEMPDPADMPFEEVLTILQIGLLAPECDGLTLGQVEALSARWMAHHDLPSLPDAQRLAYVVDRYADELAYDLRVHASMDLLQMWRGRRWRTLLATIDRLPSHSLFTEAVSMDEEHAEMLATSMAERGDTSGSPSGPAAPPLRTWTPELKAMTDLIDAVRQVEWAVIAAAAGSKAPKPPEPMPRPGSVMADALRKAEQKRRMAKHKDLTKRLLPHKREGATPAPAPAPAPALPAGWRHDAAGRLRDERGRYVKKPQ